MAAGLTIRRARYEAFRVAFLEVAGELLGPDDLAPAQRVDLELPLGLVSPELEKLMRYLEPCGPGNPAPVLDRKSTRLNSSHDQISYAVFCLKKKTRVVHNHTARKRAEFSRPYKGARTSLSQTPSAATQRPRFAELYLFRL